MRTSRANRNSSARRSTNVMTLLCGPVRASSIRAGSIRYLRILSVYLAYRRSVLDNTGELTDTTLVAALFGGPSGGTIASGRALVEAVAADRGVLDALLQPDLFKSGPIAGAGNSGRSRTRHCSGRVEHQPQPERVGDGIRPGAAQHQGCAPQQRAARLGVREKLPLPRGHEYGKILRGPTHRRRGMAGGFAVGSRVGALMAPLVTVGIVRKVLDVVLPRPGSGPNKTLRELGLVPAIQTFAHTTSGASYLVHLCSTG